MASKRGLRVSFALLILVLSLLLVNGYVKADTVDETAKFVDEFERQGAAVEPRNNVTVVTTSPRFYDDASIVAFAPNGSVLYYNETYDWYFDVDPVEGKPAVVEYVAVEQVAKNCDLKKGLLKNHSCSQNVVERVNLRTGETTRIYSHRTRPTDVGGWHDVDRIDESHLLVSGTTKDRVFVVNTSSQIIEWQWDIQSALSVESGGKFPTDWSHVNDVTLLDNGQIMVSLRNQDQVVFLDPETGLVGNSTIGVDDEHDILFEQHNPDYIPKNRGGPAVVVADSHNNRIVEYQRTDSQTWEQTWTWSDWEMQWPRDADRLPNGHTLITDSNGNRVLEINRQGEIVWEVPIDTPYEAERLGTGDESSQGQSAQRLNLRSRMTERTVQTNSTTESPPSSLKRRIIDTVKRLLPAFVVNSILFVLPPWVDFVELVLMISLLGMLGTWSVVEFRWSAYYLRRPMSLRAPIGKRKRGEE